jgi:hypothetical protein
MRRFTTADLTELLAPREGPCLSLYLPTPRGYPDNHQGRVLYRNLLDRAEQALRGLRPGGQVQAFLGRFRAPLEDPMFWTHRQDGLAVLGSDDYFQWFDLRGTVREKVVVNSLFHLKPLLRTTQAAGRYQVLCLTRARFRLFEGDPDTLDEVRLDGLPTTLEEALGGDVGVRRKDAAAETSPGAGVTGTVAGHGPVHGPEPDQGNKEAERFFRVVYKLVWERFSRPSGLPLVLAALTENQPIFRAHSPNHHLLAEGIECNPEVLKPEQLRTAAWRVVGPRYEERLARLADDFRVAAARGKGSANLETAAEVAHAGRVGSVLIDADRRLPGRLDPASGAPRPAERADANGSEEDMLDDLAELVLRRKGAVVVLPSDRMPSSTGLAAIYRY